MSNKSETTILNIFTRNSNYSIPSIESSERTPIESEPKLTFKMLVVKIFNISNSVY